MPSSSLPNPPTIPLALALDHTPTLTNDSDTDSDTDTDSTTASAIDPSETPRTRRPNGGSTPTPFPPAQTVASTAAADLAQGDAGSDAATIIPRTGARTAGARRQEEGIPAPSPAPFPCILLLRTAAPPRAVVEVVLIDPRTASIPALLAAAKDVLRTSPNVCAAEWADARRGGMEAVGVGVEVHEGRGGGGGGGGGEGGEDGKGGKGGKDGKGGKEGKGGFVREKAGNGNVNVGRKVGGKAEEVLAEDGKAGTGMGKREAEVDRDGEVDGDEKAGRTVKIHEGNLRACLMLLARGGGALVVEFRAGVTGGK